MSDIFEQFFRDERRGCGCSSCRCGDHDRWNDRHDDRRDRRDDRHDDRRDRHDDRRDDRRDRHDDRRDDRRDRWYGW